jgi:hypothetical protein
MLFLVDVLDVCERGVPGSNVATTGLRIGGGFLGMRTSMMLVHGDTSSIPAVVSTMRRTTLVIGILVDNDRLVTRATGATTRHPLQCVILEMID